MGPIADARHHHSAGNDDLLPGSDCISGFVQPRSLDDQPFHPALALDPDGPHVKVEADVDFRVTAVGPRELPRSEEHTSELQSLMRISYAVFCLKKKKNKNHNHNHTNQTEQT